MSTWTEEPVVAVGVPLLPQDAPFFLPQLYDEQVFTWSERPFVVATFSALYGVPLSDDERVQRLQAKLQASGMLDSEKLLMTPIVDPAEPVTSVTVYMSIDKARASDLPAEKVQFITGAYISKVFESYYADSDFVREMQALVMERTGGVVERKDMWASFPERKKLPGKGEETQHCIVFAKCPQGRNALAI